MADFVLVLTAEIEFEGEYLLGAFRTEEAAEKAARQFQEERPLEDIHFTCQETELK